MAGMNVGTIRLQETILSLQPPRSPQPTKLLMLFLAILVFCQKDGFECGERNVAKVVDLAVDEALDLKTGKGITRGCHDRMFGEESIATTKIGLHQDHAIIIDTLRD